MLGEPLDGQPPLAAAELWPIHRPLPSLAAPRQPLKFLETGIKVIDLLAPVARTGTAGIIGGAGIGKTGAGSRPLHRRLQFANLLLGRQNLTQGDGRLSGVSNRVRPPETQGV